MGVLPPLRGFLVTGNLKICLRVVEPPEETLLLAPIPSLRPVFSRGGGGEGGKGGGGGAVRRTTPRTKILLL